MNEILIYDTLKDPEKLIGFLKSLPYSHLRVMARRLHETANVENLNWGTIELIERQLQRTRPDLYIAFIFSIRTKITWLFLAEFRMITNSRDVSISYTNLKKANDPHQLAVLIGLMRRQDIVSIIYAKHIISKYNPHREVFMKELYEFFKQTNPIFLNEINDDLTYRRLLKLLLLPKEDTDFFHAEACAWYLYSPKYVGDYDSYFKRIAAK